MSTIKRFEDLVIWQLAREYAKNIFDISAPSVFQNDFSLINQIRASSGSVMDNIAEGFDREGNGEFKQFLSIAKGSLGESKSQLYRALDRKYLDPITVDDLLKKNEVLSRKIHNTMEYLKECDIKGFKYKNLVKEDTEVYGDIL